MVDSPAVEIGVLLDQRLDQRLCEEPGGIGAWLADAAAFDAAGADALWIDPGPESRLDVLALTAAVAAVTVKARLVVAPPDDGTDGPDGPDGPDGTEGTAAATLVRQERLARTIDTIRRLSHGRLALIADPGRLEELAPGVEVFRRVPGEPGALEGTRAGRWVSTPVPQNRAAWWTARADAAERGVRGLVVPADPRLLDILRNPDEPGDRRDLQLAQG